MTVEIKAHSTSTGSVIGPEADVVGLGGVFKKLLEEHGEATRLMSHLLTQTPEERKDLYPALRTALLSHERSEAAVVYAALRQNSSTLAVARAHAQEAAELEHAIAALDTLEIQTDVWLAQLRSLADLVRRHMEEEERDFFPQAHAALGDRESAELRVAYLRAKPGIVNTVEAESLTEPRGSEVR